MTASCATETNRGRGAEPGQGRAVSTPVSRVAGARNATKGRWEARLTDAFRPRSNAHARRARAVQSFATCCGREFLVRIFCSTLRPQGKKIIVHTCLVACGCVQSQVRTRSCSHVLAVASGQKTKINATPTHGSGSVVTPQHVQVQHTDNTCPRAFPASLAHLARLTRPPTAPPSTRGCRAGGR